MKWGYDIPNKDALPKTQMGRASILGFALLGRVSRKKKNEMSAIIAAAGAAAATSEVARQDLQERQGLHLQQRYGWCVYAM